MLAIQSLTEGFIQEKCIYSESRGETQVKLLISRWFQACCEESFTKGCNAVAAHWITWGTLYNPSAWASPERDVDLLDWDMARAPGFFKFPQVILLCSQIGELLPRGTAEQSPCQFTDCGGLGLVPTIERVEVVYREADSYIFWEDLGLILRLHHTTVDSPEHSIFARSPGCFSANHTESPLGLLSFPACVWNHSPWISTAFSRSSLEQH